MAKRLLIVLVALAFVASLSSVAGAAKDSSLMGWVTDTHCGAKGDTPKHADCARKCVKEMGAKWALYTPSDKRVYTLEGASDKLNALAGQYVKVTGTVDGDTIKVQSVTQTPEPKAPTK
jgi:hypothetical protein